MSFPGVTFHVTMETNLTFKKYIYCWVIKLGILKEKKVRIFACLRYYTVCCVPLEERNMWYHCKIARSSLIQFENILTRWWQCYRSIKCVSVSEILQSD